MGSEGQKITLPSPSTCPVLAPTTFACAEYRSGAVAVFRNRFGTVLVSLGTEASVLVSGRRARMVAIVAEAYLDLLEVSV